MLNLLGRTREQQENVDRELEASGSLWPRIPILYEFVFTKGELEAADAARRTLTAFRKKVQELAQMSENLLLWV